MAAALLAVGLLAACAPTTDASAPSPVAEASRSATSTSTPSPTTTGTTEVALSDVFDVGLGEPFLDAAERSGASQVQGCSWVATLDDGEYRLQFEAPEAPVTPDTPVELVAVTAPVGNAAQGPIGPRTAQGIGIGSTVDEARAAYPDAGVTDATDGPQRYLEVATDDGEHALFLAYSEGSPIIWGMIATARSTPEIDTCA